ncbi:hypothetical protein ACQ7CU_11690 [Chryseobacterium arthrosphaerae]|uniref:hypothetical protein n=1 Tax=Chryseobacterium arthrosphaerae TaxID=651561 RepID=UPI003D351D71
MKKILLLFILFLYSSILNAQEREYHKIGNDQSGAVWNYSFDKQTKDGFYSWIQVVNTIKQDPVIESVEYFMEYKCKDKTASDEIVKINYRDDEKPLIDHKKMPFRSISEGSVFNSLLEKYCK